MPKPTTRYQIPKLMFPFTMKHFLRIATIQTRPFRHLSATPTAFANAIDKCNKLIALHDHGRHTGKTESISVVASVSSSARFCHLLHGGYLHHRTDPFRGGYIMAGISKDWSFSRCAVRVRAWPNHFAITFCLNSWHFPLKKIWDKKYSQIGKEIRYDNNFDTQCLGISRKRFPISPHFKILLCDVRNMQVWSRIVDSGEAS